MNKLPYNVEITKERYDELIEREMFLLALEAAGVDTWDGYDEAQDILIEWDNE